MRSSPPLGVVTSSRLRDERRSSTTRAWRCLGVRLNPGAWLLTQWAGPHAAEPSDYWLSDLPADTPLEDLVTIAKARWRIEGDYRELKTVLGLDHFEGRSWTGWHRHVTLVTAAHLFLAIQRQAGKALGQKRN